MKLTNAYEPVVDSDLEANSPSSRPVSRSVLGKYFRTQLTQEVIELDDIPPIIKSANGNIFWADEQCVRRVGPTSSEARLFLRLLQMDEPEMLSYNDCKEMFDDFNRERIMLKKLIRELPWYRGLRKKAIWRARILWLDKIREPRLWLLYLMARRRRILQQATVAIMVRLRYKSIVRSSTTPSTTSDNFIPLQAMPLSMSASVPSPTQAPTQDVVKRELEAYKTSLQKRFGAKSLNEVLSSYMTNSEQESLQSMAHKAVATVITNATAKDLDGAQDDVEEVVVAEKLDGSSTAAPKPDAVIAHADTASKISHMANELRNSMRSSASRSRKRGWSHSSERVPRVPGRCPIFNMRFEATRKDIKHQIELLMPKPKSYIVIGWFLRSASDPRETILQFEDAEDLFRSMRHGAAEVRGWRRFISLKTLKGFSLYKCDIERGVHSPLVLSFSQKVILSQFFLAFQASYRHSDAAVARAWQGWVQKNLNDDKDNPLEGKYSLQLIYDWSSARLALVVIVPVALSLIIGIWYTIVTGDVGGAWTVGGYIISAAALLAALIAIIGSLKAN